jgi:hypothetical protein
MINGLLSEKRVSGRPKRTPPLKVIKLVLEHVEFHINLGIILPVPAKGSH